MEYFTYTNGVIITLMCWTIALLYGTIRGKSKKKIGRGFMILTIQSLLSWIGFAIFLISMVYVIVNHRNK
jgi:hypothetical protein